ncbi:MAG TPA: hypothetical protein VGC67_05420 [Cellulomonas sp.]
MSTSPTDGRPTGRTDRPVDDTPLIPDRSADDSDTGWGEQGTGSNDERLLRDVPPHW